MERIGATAKPHLIHPGSQRRSQQRAEIAGILELIQRQHKSPIAPSNGQGLPSQGGDHAIRMIGGRHRLHHLLAHRLQRQVLIRQQGAMALDPGRGGQKLLGLKPQPQQFLELMGALQQQQPLLTAPLGLVQRPQATH